MNRVDHWIEKGFVHYADMFVSDRLNQGVDVEFIDEALGAYTRTNKRAAVYIIIKDTKVLKFGQSANIFQRVFTEYKCISNSTNNFIRKNIKERLNHVEFYVYLIPNEDIELIGYKFRTNLQKGLEEAILKEYYEEYQTIPELNRQRN